VVDSAMDLLGLTTLQSIICLVWEFGRNTISVCNSQHSAGIKYHGNWYHSELYFQFIFFLKNMHD
jgi:hypothetical protein